MRAIDADALKEDLTRFYDNEVTARKLIDEQPTIQPEPKRGRWIYKTDLITAPTGYWECSECKEGRLLYEENFCPHCGADMREVINSQPTIQPDIVRCKDCKHWIPYDWMFSEVWRSKNMADYPEDEIGCDCCDMAMKANDFCSRGEKREMTT